MGRLSAADAKASSSQEAVELLVSRDEAKRRKGAEALDENRHQIVAALIAELGAPDVKIVEAAAYELGILFSPWAQGCDSSGRFIRSTTIYELRRPVERSSAIPEAESIRAALKQAFNTLRRQAEVIPQESVQFRDALGCVALTLDEFANDQVVDWAVAELSKVNSPYVAEALFRVVENYMGRLPVFREGALCGNSSMAEVKQFQQEQAAVLATAKADLKAQWTATKSQGGEQRIQMSIDAWRNEMIPMMRQYSGSYIHEGWLGAKCSPLIRFGSAALPQLRRQREQEADLGERAVWDYFIAAISGETDEQTIRDLMAGSDSQREMACEIITASGQTRWAAELETLKMVNDYHLGKASLTLGACLGMDAIPYLERILSRYPKEPEAGYILSELRDRAQMGEPKRRKGVRR